MRVMVFFKAGEHSGQDTAAHKAAFEAMDRFTEELVEAGVFVAAAGLKNSAEAKRVVFDGAGRTVIDGPFAEARELVAGWSIWEVRDMDEAMAWVARCPSVGPGELEIRPFMEVADLAEFVTPEELAGSAPRTGDRGKLGVA